MLFQDVVTENEFEKKLLSDVIPPSDIGVSFDDIGALENVKDTLKELVMLPLQRPELFDKGQLTKVPFKALRFHTCLFRCLSLSLSLSLFPGHQIYMITFYCSLRKVFCCLDLLVLGRRCWQRQ